MHPIPDLNKEEIAELSNDGLAIEARLIKERIAHLRSVLYLIEAEVLKRMQANNARALLGQEFKIKSTLKREVKWDQDALSHAHQLAIDSGMDTQFRQAFPFKYECSLRGLNALEKFGGKTWEAVQAAKKSEAEKISFEYEPV